MLLTLANLLLFASSHPVVDKTFQFEEARDGLQYLFSGGHFGKVVVKIA